MKRIITLALAILMVLSLAACSSPRPAVVDPTEAPRTEAPENTETATEAPDNTEEAPVYEGYCKEEAAMLAAFFELADENGVKNGDKLFDAYDPMDPESWSADFHVGIHPDYEERYSDIPAVVWDGDGHVTALNIYPKPAALLPGLIMEYSAAKLAGELLLDGFPELKMIYSDYANLDSLRIDNCPKLSEITIWGLLHGDVSVNAPELSSIWIQSRGSINCTYKRTPESETKSVCLTHGDNGGVTFICNQNSFPDDVTEIRAIPDDGYLADGWYYDGGELFTDEGWRWIEGAAAEAASLSLNARFVKAENNPWPMYEGEAPVGSDKVIEVLPNETVEADLDLDGKPDTIFLSVKPNSEDYPEGEIDIVISVTLGSDPSKVFDFSEDYLTGQRVLIADSNVSDDRLDILFIWDCYEDYGSSVLRINEADDGLDCFEIWGFLPLYRHSVEELDFTNGIPVIVNTDLFNTQEVNGLGVVTADGFRYIAPFTYPEREEADEDWWWWHTLRREMDVEKDGVSVTLPEGTEIIPVETDLWSYIVFELRDGSRVTAELENRTGRYYINGLVQDEYSRIFYAG